MSIDQSPIIIELLHPDAIVPHRATEGSAGYDLHAYVTGRRVRCSDGAKIWDAEVTSDDFFEITPGVTVLVPLGFKAQLPPGFEAQVRPRSGLSFKKGLLIPNAPGTVDADYPDEWMVPVRNPGAVPVRIAHGERIAQMVLQRYEVLEFEAGEVGVTSSRVGGFGSTG
jgi:dUTP pyrophosphatase